jgi:hypothetical protein
MSQREFALHSLALLEAYIDRFAGAGVTPADFFRTHVVTFDPRTRVSGRQGPARAFASAD